MEEAGQLASTRKPPYNILLGALGVRLRHRYKFNREANALIYGARELHQPLGRYFHTGDLIGMWNKSLGIHWENALSVRWMRMTCSLHGRRTWTRIQTIAQQST